MTQETLKLALEALEFIPESGSMLGAHAEAKRLEAITAIKEALAQTQEPVALVIDGVLVKSALPEKYTGHLYTTPPQRTWVGLTDEEVRKICVNEWGGYEQCRAIEAKLKEKNT
jgi:hypothetical protein